MRHVLLLALTLAVSATGAQGRPVTWHVLEPSPPSAGSTGIITNIYNGTPTADFPAVVGLVITNRDGSAALCSGTLIAPSAVLTAAHCLAFDPVRVVAVVYPAGTRVDYVASAFHSHPRFSLARFAVADIAIVRLASSVADVVPVPPAQRSPHPGTTGAIVGFGEDGSGRVGLKQAGTIRLRRCPRVVRTGNGRVRLAKSLCWRGNQLSDTCSGDSGGPLLVNGVVAGVTSGGIGTTECPGQLSFDTNVARYRVWIADTLRQ